MVLEKRKGENTNNSSNHNSLERPGIVASSKSVVSNYRSVLKYGSSDRNNSSLGKRKTPSNDCQTNNNNDKINSTNFEDNLEFDIDVDCNDYHEVNGTSWNIDSDDGDSSSRLFADIIRLSDNLEICQPKDNISFFNKLDEKLCPGNEFTLADFILSLALYRKQFHGSNGDEELFQIASWIDCFLPRKTKRWSQIWTSSVLFQIMLNQWSTTSSICFY